MNRKEFIKETCQIQNATRPQDLTAMERLLDIAFTMSPVELLDSVVELGNILDPSVTSLRRGPAVFANSREATAPQHIERKLAMLRDFIQTTERCEDIALEAYWAFEEIHPLADGNGRIGMVLFNIMMNTTENPSIPPDREVW